MPNSRTKYVRIFVHRDVLLAARLAAEEIGYQSKLPYNDPRRQALRDLTDPLPEPDVFGHTPHIDELELPIT